MIVHFPFDSNKEFRLMLRAKKRDNVNAIKIKFITLEWIQMIIKINRVIWSGRNSNKSYAICGIFIALWPWKTGWRFLNQDIMMFMHVPMIFTILHILTIILREERSVAVDGRTCKLKLKFMSIIISLTLHWNVYEAQTENNYQKTQQDIRLAFKRRKNTQDKISK